MRTSPLCSALRTCPNATPGPSRLPAIRLGRHTPCHLPLRPQVRYESTPPNRSPAPPTFSSPNNGISPYPHPAFDALSTSLSSWLPCFGARGDEVRLLNSPSGFYGDIIEMIKRAKRRILISTLYIGVEETELVSVTVWGLGRWGRRLISRSRRSGKL